MVADPGVDLVDIAAPNALHKFEVYGSKGALLFSQERFNELHFYSTAAASRPRPTGCSAWPPGTSSASTT